LRALGVGDGWLQFCQDPIVSYGQRRAVVLLAFLYKAEGQLVVLLIFFCQISINVVEVFEEMLIQPLDIKNFKLVTGSE